MQPASKPERPEAVVFDLGGVLVQFDERPLFELLRPELGRANWWEFVLHSEAFRGFETGILSTQAMAVVAVAELCRPGVGVPAFLEALGRWPSQSFPGARECVQRVKNTGVRRALLSNTNPLHWGILAPGFADLFDHLVLSFEIGVLKPSPLAFQCAEDRLGLRGNQLLFFDDNPHNVQAAIDRGWQAVRVAGPVDIHAALDEADWA